MTPSLDQYREAVLASGLIGAAEFERVVAGLQGDVTAQGVATELLRTNRLTRLQVEFLWTGRGRLLNLGQYQLVDKLGEGGMGQVFRAVHRTMKREVALKVLTSASLKDARAVGRFQREVEAAARLTHPNIVVAHDAGFDQNVHYLVMEYVAGCSLAEFIKQRGGLSWDLAVNFTRQAAAGLEYAHSLGVVHRDIKPGNLMVTPKGTIKVADLGLARLANLADEPSPDRPELTNVGVVMGTADFMAPEQAVDTHTADARADIYSLGCTLYVMLTGNVPYPGNSVMARIFAHRERPIPSLSANVLASGVTEMGNAGNSLSRASLAGASIPEALESIFRKMVAKQVEDRYASMAAVIEALDDLSQPGRDGSLTSVTMPVGERSGPMSEERTAANSNAETGMFGHHFPPMESITLLNATRRPAPTKRRVWVGGAAALVALLAAVVIVWLALQPSSEPEKPTAAMVIPADSGAGQSKAVRPRVPVFDPKKIPASERFPWQPEELVAVIGTHAKKHWNEIHDVKYSPDGKLIATNSLDGLLRIWSAADLTLVAEERLFEIGKDIETFGIELFWNRASDHLWMTVGDGTVRQYQLANGKLSLKSSYVVGRGWNYFSVSEDERLAATATERGDLQLWDIQRDPPRLIWSEETKFYIHSVALSPMGQTLACGSGREGLKIWKLQGLDGAEVPAGWRPEVLTVPSEIDGGIQTIHFPAEDRLVFTANGRLESLQLQPTGMRRDSTQILGGFSTVSARGRWLGIANDYGLFLHERRGNAWADPGVRLFDTTPFYAAKGAFSPDESTLIASDRNGRMVQWDVNSGAPKLRGSLTEGTHAQSAQFSPDGERLAIGALDGAVTVWKFEQGQAVRERTVTSGFATRSVCWSDDGRTLAFAPGHGNGISNRSAGILDVGSGRTEWITARTDRQFSVAVALSVDGLQLATMAHYDGILNCYRRSTTSETFRFEHELRFAHQGQSITFSPDGKRLAGVGFSNTRDAGLGVRIWDVQADPPVSQADMVSNLGPSAGHRVDWSRSGQYLANVGVKGGYGMTMWDMRFDPPRMAVEQGVSMAREGVSCVAISPDSQRILTGSDHRTVRVRGVPTLHLYHEWLLPGAVWDVAWHPSGKYVATANGNGTVYILRVPDSARP